MTQPTPALGEFDPRRDPVGDFMRECRAQAIHPTPPEPAMTNPKAFPLDAEQIVRLAAAVLTRVLNATGHRDAAPVEEDDVLIHLGRATGIALPVETYARPVGGRMRGVMPYGATTMAAPNPSCAPRPVGGSDEA